MKESQLYEVAQLCKVYSVAAIDISNALYAADYFLLYVPADFSRHEDAVRQAKVCGIFIIFQCYCYYEGYVIFYCRWR